MDLCGRLPHYTMVLMDDGGVELLVSVNVDTGICNGLKGLPRPYLQPMESMTAQEWCELCDCDAEDEKAAIYINGRRFVSHVNRENFLNSHHFDHHGLIPMGLALVAPEGMYKK